jgi:DNA repair protein RecO (recombination protein O)
LRVHRLLQRPRAGRQAARWYNRRVPSRERVFRTEAVVLRRGDFGEADRLLTVYSPDYGKLRLVAKGVRRPRSRKAGHLEPFTRVALLLARGRELDVITQAQAIEPFAPLRDDLVRLAHAAYVVELLDRFTVQEAESQALYRLLLETLDRLASGEAPDISVHYYELRLLELVGYRPELFHCLGCRAEITPVDQYFSAELGGALCPRCGPGKPGSRPLPLAALKVMRHYQRSSYPVARVPNIRPEVFGEIERLMEEYLNYLLERRLNTPAFLKRVRRTRSAAPPGTQSEDGRTA